MTEPVFRCRCPSCTVSAAVHLLETGRPRMALTLLRPLGEAMADAALAAAIGDEPGSDPASDPPPAPELYQPPPEWPVAPGRAGFPRLAAELRQHVARLGAQRVAELLRVRVADLVPLLAGTADVAKSVLRRVREAEA